jgi:K(+)-stimulated pyrophosphate-energized sodium pump
MSETVETILLYTIGAGLLSIVYGYFTGKNILNQSAGNAKMQDIASAIQIGAKAYLGKTIQNNSYCWCSCFSNCKYCL